LLSSTVSILITTLAIPWASARSTYHHFSLLLTISVHTHSDDVEAASAPAAEKPAPVAQAPPNQKKSTTTTKRGGGYYSRGGRSQAPVATPGAEETPVGEKKYCTYNFSLSPFDYPH